MPPGVAGRKTAPLGVNEDFHYYPTMDEFKDFKTYMEYLESVGAHEKGVALVHVPDEWIPRKNGYNLDDFNYEIAGPIKQHFKQIGGRGCYQTKGIVQPKLTVKEYEKLANSSQYKTPIHSTYDDLERKYWKTLSFCPPVYGCDVSDSITDPEQKSWNIRDLGTILNLVNDSYDQEIKGVNSPYLYFGMWKATFSWHVEDMDLHSINYLHYGAPKTWYVVPPKYGHLMEKAARELFPNVASWCSNFMRHKTCLISPQQLDKYGIPYTKVVQPERCAIIVFPYAYHSGFNHGFNIAESTNFALERWIEYGKRARQCDCSRSRVTFSMDTFVKRFQPEKYEDWKNGRDIAPHPEDPEDVREQVMLRARDPEEYRKMMQERLWLGDKTRKRAKPRATCTEEVKGEQAAVDASKSTGDAATKTYRVYRHHEYKMLQVTLNPETWHCYRGLQKFREMLDMDDEEDVNFEEMVGKGLLIHIDDEEVNLGIGKRVREPPEISQDVCVYAHKDQPHLEATVNPVTLSLVGDQSKDLLEYLDNNKEKIKQEITSGIFEFKMNGMIRIPNPNYNPEDENAAKRARTEGFLSNVSVEAMEQMDIRAFIYRHMALNELVTLTGHGNLMSRMPSKAFLECLDDSTVKDLVEAGTLVKVGERKVNLSAKLGSLAHGHFTFGSSGANVEVAAGRSCVVYKVKTANEDAVQSLKTNSLRDLVNSRLLVRKTVDADLDKDHLTPSEVMVTALAFPCSVTKCDQHGGQDRVVTSDADQGCGCVVRGQHALARNLKTHRDVMVIVDEKTNTATLAFGPETLIIKRSENVGHDLLDSYDERGNGADTNGEPTAPDDDDDDEFGEEYDEDDSDEENQAFTSDEEQESDAESSDDPDFEGGRGFDSYSWKHSSAQKRKKSKAKKAEMAKMRERRYKERGMRGGGGMQSKGNFQRRKRNADYEGFVVTTKAILERFEVLADGGGVDPMEKDMISPSELATTLQRPFVEVSKAMELFKLFEIAELIDENEMLYQWVDTERLELLLKRIYNDVDDDVGAEPVGLGDLWKIVKGVVKVLLTERRGRRFYVPMLAYEQFSSVSKTPQVNEVMAFLVAMNLASSRVGEDHFGGFEYRGPDIDKGERERLFGRHRREFGLQDATVAIYKLELGDDFPMPRVRKHPKILKIYKKELRKDWDEERVEAERVRSLINANKVCKCGTSVTVKGLFSRNGHARTKVRKGTAKKTRCRACPGCLEPKCGVCRHCTIPHLKQACVNKKCQFPVIPKCPCFD